MLLTAPQVTKSRENIGFGSPLIVAEGGNNLAQQQIIGILIDMGTPVHQKQDAVVSEAGEAVVLTRSTNLD